MTMVNVGIIEWPTQEMAPGFANNGGAGQAITLDSTSDAFAWVGQSPIADSITKIYFRTGTIPASGGDTVDVRIETVANGRPTGTLWGTNTNITVAIADTDDGVWKTATLTTAATLSVGDEFAIVIASSAGTPSIQLFGVPSVLYPGQLGNYPIILHNATGSYAYQAALYPEWIVEFSSAGVTYIPGLSPIDGNVNVVAFDNSSSPNERAMRLRLPFKARCIGAKVFVGNIAAGGDYTVSLWDATGNTDGEALAQSSIDGDYVPATTSDSYASLFWAGVTLEKDTTYYVGLRPDTANSISIWESPTAGTGEPATAIKAFSHGSAELYLATRVWSAGSAGAWSTTTTTLPIITLLLDQLDDGAGGAGGLLTHPGMSGGMRG